MWKCENVEMRKCCYQNMVNLKYKMIQLHSSSFLSFWLAAENGHYHIHHIFIFPHLKKTLLREAGKVFFSGI